MSLPYLADGAPIRTELKLAALNLLRNRKRTLVSLAAIIVGVIGYLLAGGFIEWIYWAIREAAIQNGLGHIQVSVKGYRDAGFADPGKYVLPKDSPQRKQIEQLPAVEVIAPRLQLSGLISSGEITVPFSGEGVDPVPEARVSKVLQVNGRNLDAADPTGVLVGQGLATTLGVKPGDAVVFIHSRPQGGVTGVEGVVRGVFSTGIKAYDDVAARIPIAMAQRLLRTEGAHLWVIGLHETEMTQRTVDLLQQPLSQAGLEQRSWLELSDFYRKTVELLSRQMAVVTVLIAIILVLGIANLLTMATLERTGEIGTMLAVGTPRSSILRMHVAEGVLLGAVGAVVGATLGVVLALAISAVGIPMPPPPGRDTGYRAEILVVAPLIANAVAIAVVSATLASAYPAWKASRLPVVDALRANR